MANQYHPFLLLSLLLPLLSIPSSSSSTFSHEHHQDHHHHPVLKSLHFSLYQHETINQTGYIIVNGVAGAGFGQTTSPFGTIIVFNDKLTTSKSSNSSVAGIAEGTSITSSINGLQGVSFAKITLKIKGHQGSISIVGGTNNVKPADHPVVGGTGDFLFVQGFVRSLPVELQGLRVVYKIEFNLYWPPYAAAVHGFK
ncbi:dirigent protein 11-like [Dioscorea cayenensis subsp. rotundata]|uniref:Dirigent protein n=1 Tax=Dioscorea cayennensis subsp. rotundata TaxID=55577 RepID=A0AB40C6P0_DIOCR|nr:dirigent protein 11-like [Dioscorea cayenensis subsp. rotundata]